MAAILRGIGIVGGFGSGVPAFEKVLVHRGPTAASLAVPDPQPLGGHLHVKADLTRLGDRFPARSLRRLDRFARMALFAADLALEDGQPFEIDEGMGIVVATGYGAAHTTFAFLDTVLEGGDPCGSPTLFSGSVHNAAAAHISMHLGATGPNLTVSQFDLSVSGAFSIALQWLTEGRVTAVLVGAVDTWCPVLGHCFHRFFGPASPLDCRNATPDTPPVVPAEGAVFFLLASEKGPGPGYGIVESVQTGGCSAGAPTFPEKALILVGDDGCPQSPERYARRIPGNREVASYFPLYGTLPVGMGFDMAVAGLMMRRDRIFPMPASPLQGLFSKEIRSGGPLEARRICCLGITPSDTYGMITLSREGAPGAS